MKILASLRARVVTLLALTILPLLALSFQVNLEARNAARARAEMRIDALAQAMADEEQHMAENAHQLLTIMAHANDVERLESPECSGLAKRLLATQPLFNNFGAALPDGSLVCSSGNRGPTPISVKDRQWFQEAMAFKRFTRGEPVVGLVSGKQSFVFGLPILTPRGELKGVVFASVGISWLERLLRQMNLPSGWEAGILDSNNQQLTALPQQSSAALRIASTSDWATMAENKNTLLHAHKGPDGESRLTHVSPLNSMSAPIWFYISVPKKILMGAIEKDFRTQLLVFICVALGATVLSFWLLDSNILAWTRKLTSAFHDVSQGKLGRRLEEHHSIRELELLNRSFNGMAENLMRWQQRQVEDARHIARASRLYCLLSAVNQCIVTATNRNELLGDICRIAVDKGGFSLAWIGFVDGDSMELTPITQAGQTGFLLQGERPMGPSPAATAYHSGRLAIVDDIQNSPPSIWRDQAHLAGFHAAAAIPLRHQQQSAGVLTLYSRHPGVFDSSEKLLLEEIGGDVSYALDRLENETAKQLAESRLARLNEELEQRVAQRTAELLMANQDLEAFSFSVSHDLRAPLRAMSGYAQLIKQESEAILTGDCKHFLNRLVHASEHMNQLIDDLLRYSRLGKRGIQMAELSLEHLVSNLLVPRLSRIQETQAVIEFAQLPDVLSDATLLEQILSNLIDNALTYHQAEHPPQIRITARREEDFWELSVEDQGIGIAPEHQEKIFAVFQRLLSDSSYPGHGIGLAIVRKAVQYLKGSISLTSEPGEGSTFTLRFPTTPSST